MNLKKRRLSRQKRLRYRVPTPAILGGEMNFAESRAQTKGDKQPSDRDVL